MSVQPTHYQSAPSEIQDGENRERREGGGGKEERREVWSSDRETMSVVVIERDAGRGRE